MLKRSNCPKWFFSQKIKFSCTYAPFILQNLKKIIRADSELWGCVPFVLNIFLVQTIIFTFIYLLALFIVQNLKKFLRWIQSYVDAPFLGPEWSICPNFFLKNYQYHSHLPIRPFHCAKFLKKPVNEPCFFHSCLSTCQKPNHVSGPFLVIFAR